jgi:formamidopyrimidine-DNA glycosylase
LPELPEVEICRRSLDRWCEGRLFVEALIADPAAIRGKLVSRPSERLEDGVERWEAVVGCAHASLHRHGKRIGWVMGDQAWLVHLGMTGKWVRRQQGAEVPRFGRIGLRLDDGHALWFVDTRRFGCISPVELDRLPSMLKGTMGPDALDEPMTGRQLQETLRGRRAIKTALMDQTKLAGLGNIHAMEALWRCGIKPTRPCGSLDPSEFELLAEALLTQLRWTIAEEGDGEMRYLSEGGRSNPFSVYGRAGESCPRCKGDVVSMKHSGRTSFWCDSCQA